MTVSSSTNKFRYQGNGVTDTFAITGRIFATGDYTVQILTRATDAVVETLVETTNYTITINGPESASVVVDSAKIPSATQDILIFRDLDQTQTVDLPTGTRFPAVSVENALDKTTALVQDLSETIGRAVLLPINSSATAPGIGSLTTNEVVIYDGTDFATDGTTTTDIQNAATSAIAAASSATAASGSATLASNWATLTGSLVAATDYSAKEYAIGTTVAAGSAKDWAITPEDTLVDGSGYSALHWAAKAADYAAGVNLPSLGAANTLLGVNSGGTALEYIALLDEDDMASDSATRAPTQQSVKAYVDNNQSGIIDVQVFTSSGTWTKPAGCNAVEVWVIGGGGGGFEDNSSNHAAGGGGGGAYKYITSGLGSTETVTVGTGGTGDNTTPTAGGTSSFGAHASATGGAAGANAAGGQGGAGSNGNVNVSGQDGESASSTIPDTRGGDAPFGLGFGGVPYTAQGHPGQLYGGGGGSDGSNAGNGAAGIVIVKSYS